MTTIEQDDGEPAFARGIAGPLGKLDCELKTKVDEHTYALFMQHCARCGTKTADILRDFIYYCAHEKTYTQMVADQRVHEAKRIEAMRSLIGPFKAPEFFWGKEGA